jgi:hypothetical protein
MMTFTSSASFILRTEYARAVACFVVSAALLLNLSQQQVVLENELESNTNQHKS